jgi:hypothetical protein
MSLYGYTDRAIFLLRQFDLEERELDYKQLYVYYMAYEWYYHEIGDDEKYKEYIDKINKEFEDEEVIYIDEETGERVTDEDMIYRANHAAELINKGEKK